MQQIEGTRGSGEEEEEEECRMFFCFFYRAAGGPAWKRRINATRGNPADRSHRPQSRACCGRTRKCDGAWKPSAGTSERFMAAHVSPRVRTVEAVCPPPHPPTLSGLAVTGAVSGHGMANDITRVGGLTGPWRDPRDGRWGARRGHDDSSERGCK